MLGFIYKILSFLNLQFALLVLVVGLVLYMCGVFEGGGIPLLIFCLLFIGSLLAAVIITITKIFTAGKDKKKDKENSVQILSQEDDDDEQPKDEQTTAESGDNQEVLPQQPLSNCSGGQEDKPRYYKVKQNPNYVMAEYSDRYELFLITPQGMKKIRTDYKQRG